MKPGAQRASVFIRIRHIDQADAVDALLLRLPQAGTNARWGLLQNHDLDLRALLAEPFDDARQQRDVEDRVHIDLQRPHQFRGRPPSTQIAQQRMVFRDYFRSVGQYPFPVRRERAALPGPVQQPCIQFLFHCLDGGAECLLCHMQALTGRIQGLLLRYFEQADQLFDSHGRFFHMMGYR